MARRREEIELSLIDNFTRGLRGIEKGVSGLGASITKVNQAAELAAKGINLIGAAIDKVGSVVGGVADLEEQLERIGELSNATAEEQVAFYEAVTTAGDRYKTTADEAAEALRLLVEDGFRGSEAVDALNNSLAFAQANSQTAAQAVGALGAILDQFGERATKLSPLADAISAVSREADTSAASIQEGLQRVGVAAEQANLSVEQTTAILGVLAQKGIEGGRGAQSFATALQDLQNPASTAGKALEELGLSGDDFIALLAKLQTDGKAAEEVLSALGNRPRAAIQALLDQGGGALDQFIGVVNSAAGASQEAGKVIEGSLNFQLNRLSNAIDKLKNDALTPILEPLADSAQALADKLAELASRPEFEDFVQRVGEFAQQAADKLVSLVEGVDFDEITAKVSAFAAETQEALSTLAKAAGLAIDGLKLLVDATTAASNVVQPFIDYQVRAAQAIVGTFEKVSLLDDAYRLLTTRQETVAESAERVAVAMPQIQRAMVAIQQPNQQLIEEFRQVIEKLKGVELAVQQVTPSLRDYELAITEAANAGDSEGVAFLTEQYNALKVQLKETEQAAIEAAGGLNGLKKSIREALEAGNQEEAQRLADQFRVAKQASDDLDASVEKLIGTQGAAAKSMDQLGDSTAGAAKDVAAGAQQIDQAASKVDDTFAAGASAAAAIAQQIQRLRAEFSSSAGAAELFEQRLANVNRQLLGSGLSTSIGQYETALNKAAEATRRNIAAQAQLADQIEQGLGMAALQGDIDGTIARLQGLEAETRNSQGQFKLLSQQRLDKLRSEIRATTAELLKQKQATEQLIDLTQQLQDEADRRAGRDDAVAERDFQRQLQLIQELERQGGASSRRQADEARRLARQNHEENLREIRERAQAEQTGVRETAAVERQEVEATSNARIAAREREAGAGSFERGGQGGQDSRASSGGVQGPGGSVTYNINITAPTTRELSEEIARNVRRGLDDARRRGL